MKTEKPNQEKEFDTVKTFRAIKEKISLEIAGMNFDQIQEYLKTNSAKFNAEREKEIHTNSFK